MYLFHSSSVRSVPASWHAAESHWSARAGMVNQRSVPSASAGAYPVTLPSWRNQTHHESCRIERVGDPIGRKLRPSQNAIVPSLPPLTMVSPSGENDTVCTAPAAAFTDAEAIERSPAAATLMKPAELPIATREP